MIAHEARFQRSYLAEVLAGSGATIAGAVGDAAGGLALLSADPPPHALVLSPALPDEGAANMAHTASSRGILTLLVESARSSYGDGLHVDGVLASPYAGFQVVDALEALLKEGSWT